MGELSLEQIEDNELVLTFFVGEKTRRINNKTSNSSTTIVSNTYCYSNNNGYLFNIISINFILT